MEFVLRDLTVPEPTLSSVHFVLLQLEHDFNLLQNKECKGVPQ